MGEKENPEMNGLPNFKSKEDLFGGDASKIIPPGGKPRSDLNHAVLQRAQDGWYRELYKDRSMEGDFEIQGPFNSPSEALKLPCRTFELASADNANYNIAEVFNKEDKKE